MTKKIKEKKTKKKTTKINYFKNFRFTIKNIKKIIKPLTDKGNAALLTGKLEDAVKFYKQALSFTKDRKIYIEDLYPKAELGLKPSDKLKIKKVEQDFSFFKDLLEDLESKVIKIEYEIKGFMNERVDLAKEKIDNFTAKGDYSHAVSKTYEILKGIQKSKFSYLIEKDKITEIRKTLPHNQMKLYIYHCDMGDEYNENNKFELAKLEYEKAKNLVRRVFKGEAVAELIMLFVRLVTRCDSEIKKEKVRELRRSAENYRKIHKYNDALSCLIEAKNVLLDLPVIYRDRNMLNRVYFMINQTSEEMSLYLNSQ